MFDLPVHSAFLAELFSRKEKERPPALLAHLSAHLPDAGGASRPAPFTGPELAALTLGLEPAAETARAFLDAAKRTGKPGSVETVRTPLFFELAACLEGARDAAQALFGALRGAVLAMARTQSAALRRLGNDPKALARAKDIQRVWKTFESALGAGGAEARLAAFFQAAAALLSLAAQDEIKSRVLTLVMAQTRECVLGSRESLTASVSLDPRRILKRAGAAPSQTANGAQSVPPALEAKIYQAVDAVSPSPLPPALRAFLKNLALGGRLLERHAALAREMREKEEELFAARKKYKAAKARSRKDVMLRALTLGARKPDSFAGHKTLRLALDSMEEDFESLRDEAEMSANRPAAYLKAASACLTALLETAKAQGAAFVKRVGGKEAAKAFQDAMKTALGPESACSPDLPGFWTPLFFSLAASIAAASLKKTGEALNGRNQTMYHGHFPAIAFEIAPGAAAVEVRAATPDGCSDIFRKTPSALLAEIDAFGQGLTHSRKEKERAKALHARFAGLAALLDAPEAKLSGERLAKRRAYEKKLPAIKIEMADGIERLASLHRAEMRRAGPSAVIAASDAFFAALMAKYGDAEAGRIAKIKETALYARTLSAALPGMNGGDEPPGVILGEEILLGLEDALTGEALDIEAAEAAVRSLFDAARSTLMNMDPATLKQIMRKDPSLSRALNFLAGDAKGK